MSQRWGSPGRSSHKDTQNNVEGRWKVKTFFFLLISFQSFLLPWMPHILQSAGLSYYGMALVMSTILVSSVVSIKMALALVTVSRSGAFRRLVLFLLLSSSILMYIFSVILLPVPSKYIECRQKIELGQLLGNNNSVFITHPEIITNATETTTAKETLHRTLTSTTETITTESPKPRFTTESIISSTVPVLPPNKHENNSTTSSRETSLSSSHANSTVSTTSVDSHTREPFHQVSANSGSSERRHNKTVSVNNNLSSDSLTTMKPIHSLRMDLPESNSRRTLNRIFESQGHANLRENYGDSIYYPLRNDYDSNSDYDDQLKLRLEGNNYRNILPYRYRKKRSQPSVKKQKEADTTISNVELSSVGQAEREPTAEENSSYKHNYTWLGVSLLLLFATLFGCGIEASVTRLWHCYSHGYHLFHRSPRYDMGGDDLLERTLTDTFELSATGEHYGWSRVLSGITILAVSILLTFGCQIGLPPGWSLLGQMVAFAIGGLVTIFCLLIALPIPWGSIKSPKTPRPLSLYLDDEVLWEGLRRIASPTGTVVHGVLISLPKVYVVTLLTELAIESELHPEPLAVLGVASCLIGEGFILCFRRSISSMLDSPGLMSVALGLLALQMLATWGFGSGSILWCVALSWLVVGMSQAFTLISVRQNALMLATITDQEREAWVSWCSGHFGMALGSLMWPVVAQGRWGPNSLQQLLLPLGCCSSLLSFLVFIFALITRSRRSARRRVYHTLDLHSAEDDDESSDENEDWLVKGARKEGLSLD